MRLVESYSGMQSLMVSIKNLRKGFITNFYPEEFKINLWISENSLFFEKRIDTVFFFHKDRTFISLFYCSTSLSTLSDSLGVIKFDDIFVTDIVTNDFNSSILNIFYNYGFIKHSSLVRMSKVNKSNDYKYNCSISIRNAMLTDIPEIRTLLISNFDKYTEQIPAVEKLKLWIEEFNIIVYELDSKIVGFIIYDLIGLTLYLRYWFVRAEYRDKKIGSELFKEFLYRGKETKRQIFWVIESNNNAIKRYEHYGFEKEKMYDYVLLKNE